MDRRIALQTCAKAAGLLVASNLINIQLFEGGLLAAFQQAKLVDVQAKPLKAGDIQPGVAMVFHYPHRATPCLLVNLGGKVPGGKISLQDGTSYDWPGGVGPQGSIVAFSAICSHLLTHPTKKASMVTFKPDKGSIQCCAHRSEFDLASGATPTKESPTKENLAAVILGWDAASDALTAQGMIGPEKFAPFFSRFKPQLMKDYESAAAAKELVEQAVAIEQKAFTANFVQC